MAQQSQHNNANKTASNQPILLISTAPTVAVAKAIAEPLVAARQVACVNILPACHSIYRWEGKVEQDEEALLLIKTTQRRADEVIARINALHPYDVPEAIAIPITHGYPPYLAWLAAQTQPA